MNTFLNSPCARQIGHALFILITQVPQHDKWKHFTFKYYACLSKHILHNIPASIALLLFVDEEGLKDGSILV